ncbi:hypothetical protein HN789_05195 [archaeon]|jgi:glycine betaine catabolism B|nr:hypothetical protein [archaeon]MBT4022907.1 hypothetical protein [archaeon]MBT4272554.1 hypothetical protein [archaeon]MBT4460378.1 hypothetical protein [archaeon]MBT4859009.1 hypothetical protein [archaeon]
MTERIKVKLVEIVEETDTMKTFKFVSLKNEIPFFSPGQFVFLYAKINGEEIKRSYSISSSPLDKTFDLGLELVENGKMTTYFHKNVKIGDIFEISSPLGHIKFNKELAKRVVMISGGSGIVPMRSICRYATQKNLETQLTLIYSTKTESKIAYNNELLSLEKENSSLKIINTLTRNKDPNWKGREGRVSKEIILEAANKDLQNTVFIICGSGSLNKSMSNMLKEMGINRKQIKIDVWGH